MHSFTLIAALALGGERTPETMEWKVDGVDRAAILFPPAKDSAAGAPVVFGFHGHGGGMRQAARSFQVQAHFPEALVIYMQGLPTPGFYDPEGKKSGWQRTSGDQMDRDLKFFDAVLQSVKRKYKVDERRIYAMGHSNGGAFTYLLWATRGNVLAAVAPSSAPGGKSLPALKPLPVLHVAGKEDRLVPFAAQERTMDAVRKVNGCEAGARDWGKLATRYDSKTGTPFVALVHPGGHAYLQEATPLIVRFFREHARPAK